MDKSLSQGGSNTLLAQTRKLLRKFDLRAKKGLGQHFLIDDDVLETILATAELSPTDTVIEVGPGLGLMTAELARRAGWVRKDNWSPCSLTAPSSMAAAPTVALSGKTALPVSSSLS